MSRTRSELVGTLNPAWRPFREQRRISARDVPRRAAKGLMVGLLVALLASCAQTHTESVVVAGNARFEFLTPSLVRMEYAPSGKFVDAPTAVVQKRDWPAVPVQSTREDGWLVASTRAMTLRYRLGSGPFTATNLEVSWNDPAGGSHRWHPGDADPLNLGGLTYSLDNVSASNLPNDPMDLGSPVNDEIPGIDLVLPPARPGLLSRSGYAFIDDSRTPVWNTERTWIEPRQEPNGQDWYVFTYNRNYPQVLQDYARLCGPIPMVPRYVLGPWITDLNFEYFPDSPAAKSPAFARYGQQHLEEELSRLRREHIPVDNLVLDFAWHNYGWEGGYDWSPLIPDPDGFMKWLEDHGIRLALNDHPGYINTGQSILSFSDSRAPAVLRALGRPLPPQPSFDLDLSKQWTFAADPRDRGLTEHWYAPSHDERNWKPIRIGEPWPAASRADGRRIGWYRASVQLPASLPPHLYLYLGEVRTSYRIFVNGTEAMHSQIHWPRRLTYTDITPYVHAGQPNEIMLRVESAGDDGGIALGPVAIRDVEPPERIAFDLSNSKQADVFMRELHRPLMEQGVDVWWIDGGNGAVGMPGLDGQLWTNKVYYDEMERQTGKRAFILGRYGGWGSERYPGFFTGDTYSEWRVLAYEVAFTARGGNVLVPYISHDIGGFHGKKIDYDLYARWLEFGTFSPILRLHSAHENPLEGNLRMPWTYGPKGIALARKYFTLRRQLLPYLYTYTWLAHKESLPLVRPLYLQYPDLEEAYRHPHEYFFGSEMLVAPVLDASGDREIYLPPGQWLDFFTGARHAGETTFTAHYNVDETPVFVREGAIIPEQRVNENSSANASDPLILNVYGSGRGRFDLYEDDGISLDYRKGQYSLTTLTYTTSEDGVHRLLIGPTRGAYPGQLEKRGYELRLHAIDRPSSLSVDGKTIDDWTWEADSATALVKIPGGDIRKSISVVWK